MRNGEKEREIDILVVDTVRTHHMSLSCRGLTDIATFRRLLRAICSEVRYFSNMKSNPSGVRAPITNTAMVMSTGRLQNRRVSYVTSVDRYENIRSANRHRVED